MSIIEIILIAVGLALDAFAVSIAKGLSLPKIQPKHLLAVALWFGGFQGLMPLVGYLVGISFVDIVQSVSHWIAFMLLAFIGGNMIREALKGEEDEEESNLSDFGPKTMSLLAIATSIDALAVGVTFAFVEADVAISVVLIAIITAVISMIGLKFGNLFGSKFESKAGLIGGIVLVLIGLKILIQGLFF